jgi:hypothetical protein
MNRSLGIISGAFALRSHRFARRNRVAAGENGIKNETRQGQRW